MFILYDHVFSAIKAVGGGLPVQKSEDLGPHLSRRATGHREPLLPIDKMDDRHHNTPFTGCCQFNELVQ